MQKQSGQSGNITKQDEQILVVKRSTLFPNGAWHGVSRDNLEQYVTLIREQHEFQPRSMMEQDPQFKQIIPYLVFCHDDRYFLMQRAGDASEQRLKNKYTLGIGGHMRQEDMQNGADIFAWAKREFEEEVSYDGSFTITPLGLLNDDSNPVGQVHLGLVLLLQGDSANIRIKSELQKGELCTPTECKDHRDRMESWSQLVLDCIAD